MNSLDRAQGWADSPLTEAEKQMAADIGHKLNGVCANKKGSILTDHMMLQATELGHGSVWICYFKPDVIRKEFGLPDNLEPINILDIGYSDEGTG